MDLVQHDFESQSCLPVDIAGDGGKVDGDGSLQHDGKARGNEKLQHCLGINAIQETDVGNSQVDVGGKIPLRVQPFHAHEGSCTCIPVHAPAPCGGKPPLVSAGSADIQIQKAVSGRQRVQVGGGEDSALPETAKGILLIESLGPHGRAGVVRRQRKCRLARNCPLR